MDSRSVSQVCVHEATLNDNLLRLVAEVSHGTPKPIFLHWTDCGLAETTEELENYLSMSKWIAWTHLRHDMAHLLALPRHASSPTRIPSDRKRQTHGLQLRTGTVFAFNEMKAPLISNNTPWRSIMQIKKAHRIMYSLDPKAMCNGKADVPISCPNWHSSHPALST